MTRMRHKRNHHARRDISRSMRTRARKLDADQIHARLTDPSPAVREADGDKAGLGLFYCIACDRNFPSANDEAAHKASKLHKRKVKKALEEPYTQEEADRAAGMGVDKKQRGPAAEKKKDVDEAMVPLDL